MVLESLNNLNIKRMVLETPEKAGELPFDVERDITQEDWANISLGMERYNNKIFGTFASEEAMAIKFLRSSIDLDLDEKAWSKMKESLEDSRNDDWSSFALQAMEMKMIDPGVDLGLDKHAWDWMKRELEAYRNINWRDFVKHAMAIKILDPNIGINLSGEDREEIRQSLNDCRNSDWHLFAQRAMAIKIINSDIDLNLNKEAWDGMKKYLYEQREMKWELWNRFVTQAMAMKILTAQEVKITNSGIELVMPKPKVKPTKDIPPMPEVKKF